MECRKKITFLLYSFEDGGVEKVTINLAKGLKNIGYDIEFVCFKKHGEFLSEVKDDFIIHELNINRSSESIFKLIKYFRQHKPDVFFTAKHYINIMVLIAKGLSRTKSKVIVAGHGMFFKRKGMLAWLMKLFYPKADKIVAVSSGVAQNIHEITNIPLRKITVIYNPVITKEMIENFEQTKPLQNTLGQKLIVSIGRLSPEKDFKTLIIAFQIVRQTHPLKLVIIGEGPERNNLEELIRELKLSEDVLLSGFKKNPFEYLKAADLYVLSSITEGLPTVLIEALYSMTPIVSTDCPSGPREILENGKYGLLTPVGDSDKLAKVMEATLFEKKMDTSKLRDRALQFTSEKSINKYQKLIESI